jgi:two-component system, NtrC family, response regulator
VRELVNVLDGAVALSGRSMTLFANHLPVQMRVSILEQTLSRRPEGNGQHSSPDDARSLPNMRDFRENIEKEYLGRLIDCSMNDIQEATRISGLSKSRLYEFFAKHKMTFSKSHVGDVSP